jgi:hypothetical protein
MYVIERPIDYRDFNADLRIRKCYHYVHFENHMHFACIYVHVSVFLEGVFVPRPRVTVSSWSTVPTDNFMRSCELAERSHLDC